MRKVLFHRFVCWKRKEKKNSKMNLPKLNYKVILIVSIILMAFGIGLFLGFPKLLKKMVKGVSNVPKCAKDFLSK